MAKTEIIESKIYGGEVTVKFYPNSHRYKVTDPKMGLVDASMKGVTTYLGIKDKSAALQSWTAEIAGLHLLDIIEAGKQVTNEDIAVAMNLYNEKKDEAATIGKKAHDWCEYFIKHQLGLPGYEKEPTLPEDPQILLGVDSFLEFVNNNNVEFIASEKFVYSRKHQYVGQMDFKARVNGKLMCGDFKTSNGLYNTVFAQTGAYLAADEEEMEAIGTPEEYEGSVAVRLAKETEEEYCERMARKNAVRALLGKEPRQFEPYNPFEVRFSEGREAYNNNFQGFLHCKNLHKWDEETDFYKNDKK